MTWIALSYLVGSALASAWATARRDQDIGLRAFSLAVTIWAAGSAWIVWGVM